MMLAALRMHVRCRTRYVNWPLDGALAKLCSCLGVHADLRSSGMQTLEFTPAPLPIVTAHQESITLSPVISRQAQAVVKLGEPASHLIPNRFCGLTGKGTSRTQRSDFWLGGGMGALSPPVLTYC